MALPELPPKKKLLVPVLAELADIMNRLFAPPVVAVKYLNSSHSTSSVLISGVKVVPERDQLLEPPPPLTASNVVILDS